ncbi:MAG: histidine kinase dimerization/phospho-acceptor domain-containing protein [candidate division Zixibacteria bacterium]
MKISDPQIHYAMSLVKSIARARPGEMAESCGSALLAMAEPLAVRVDVHIEGIEPELFESGKSRDMDRIHQVISDYKLGNLRAERRFPDYLSVSTEDDRLLSIAVIKHLGNPVGLVIAVSDFKETPIFPLEESLYLTASQLGARIHSVLSPGSRNAMEITGRRLFTEITKKGVSGIAIVSIGDIDDWIVIGDTNDKLLSREAGLESRLIIDNIKSGDSVNKSILQQFWPGSGINCAYWTSELPGYIMAVGFSETKTVTKQTKTAIKSIIEKMSAADADYIIKSFEKLKADFNKLVKTERATAITETAVTVNHEINNPLTAILGNTQLMLMNEKELPEDIVTKLKTIERSAVQIRETTAKLMSIIEPVRAPYASGLDMIDIERSKKKED